MDATLIGSVCGFALLSGAVSWKMSVAKKRRAWLWTAVGALFNVPGMLLVAFLPVRWHTGASPASVVTLVGLQEPARPIAV
jgi:hypothetical protein